MRGILYKLPFLASFLLMSLAYSEANELESEAMIARSNNKSRTMNSRDMNMKQNRQMNQSDDSLCFEPRCGCETDYKRCCFGLPLPVKCGWAFIEGEYLYWKTYALIPYAALGTSVPPFDINNSTPMSRDIKTVELGGDSGYRLSLGVYFTNCSFGVARYTQYSADGTDGFDTFFDGSVDPVREQVSPMWMAFVPPLGSPDDLRANVSAKHRFREKLLDFDFYRVYTCSRYSFNPFVGVRFAWLKTDLRVDYNLTGTFSTPIVGNFPFNSHVDVNHHLNLGVGLHTGLDMNVDLCWGFGLYGTSAFSALIGQKNYRIRNDFTATIAASGEARAGTVTHSYKKTDFQTNWQAGLGLNWGKHFCKCCYYLGLKVGYEVNVWPTFVSFIDVINDGNSGLGSPVDWTTWTRSVLTHGLTLGARFDF